MSGNLGINIAEGVDNAQANNVALASVDVGNVFGNAQIFNAQQGSGTARINNYNLNASVGDNSLSSVTGNVGVNVASGVGNIQNNSLAGAVTTTSPGYALTTAMVATDNNTQSANMVVTGAFQGTASLGANTLNGASGNIGVNIAGGAGNLQHNGLAIAALNSGHYAASQHGELRTGRRHGGRCGRSTASIVQGIEAGATALTPIDGFAGDRSRR